MTESSRFILWVALHCVIPFLVVVGVFQFIGSVAAYRKMSEAEKEEMRANEVTPEQRRQSLRKTWNGEKPKGDLVGATIGWTPGDKREKVEREGRPVEYVRKLPHKTKAEAWSKQK